MTYVLAPSAARDLEILWQHLADEASEAIADAAIFREPPEGGASSTSEPSGQ
jgi:hypothetical protein